MKLPRALALLALAAPALCQSEAEGYFSLNSYKTSGSGGKPSVSLNAYNIDALEFRVYRVNDPLQFFQQLESPHEFGGRAPRPAHQRTLLERIHDWKHGMRTGIRLNLRGQFTESPSKHMESVLPKDSAPATGPATVEQGQRFAAVPVLNPQQLVLRFVHAPKSKSRWDTQTVPVGVKDPGVYLVEAVHGDLRAYTILMVTDLVMITKTGTGKVVNFVASRATGEPVNGAEIVMMTRDGATKVKAQTGPDGVCELDAPGGKPDDVRVVAHQGANFALTTLASYAFGGANEAWTGYIYTDRPVYRPGHTVHFKGILRVRTAAGFDVPAGKQLAVEIQDAEQKPVYRKTLTATATGTVHDELVLPVGAALGNYFISVKFDDAFMNGNFEVEEYKKPEYEVRVTIPKPRVLQGESAQAVIEARYFFGEPVSGAKVKYAVFRSPYYFPLWYEPGEDGERQAEGGDSGDNEFGDEQVLEEEGVLDAEGKLTVRFDTTQSAHRIDYRYRIEARITDEGRREITGRNSVIATYGTFLVNTRPERYFYAPGARMATLVEARDYDSKPVRTRVHVELIEVDWRNESDNKVRAATDVETSADGRTRAEMQLPAQGGSYLIRATARTPEGRDVRDDSSLWVSGGRWGGVDGGDRKTVQMVPDKKTYHPGDTAKVMIVAGEPNTPIFVTIEGRDLKMRRLLRSPESTAILEIPISAQEEPGFFVTAAFLRKGTLYQAAKYIRVPPDDHKLQVAIATDKPQYLPGQTAQYSIQVNGVDGKPVPKAEFSLGVVDEAIYSIRRDATQDPLAFFFGHEWNRVRTEDSMNYYFTGEAGKRRMQLAALRAPTRLAQLKPERMVQPKIRKAFPDTAFWAADLTTDAAGRAQTKVEFPDSLTTWRATARGVTADTKVGAATLKTIVRKNVIVRLSVPRFFVQGDEVTVSVLVHNYLPNPKKARVSLDVAGLQVMEGAAKEVEVLSRGEVRVDWRVRAQQVDKATLTAKALTDEESDALEIELPINSPGLKMAAAKGGAVAAGQAASFDLAYPEKVHNGSRLLVLRLSPSIAGSLFGALDYLTTFPYGCVEQTMSSFLPNVIVTRAVAELGLKTNLDAAGVQQKIRAGIDRLDNFQHEDGGWGWWETDESHPFMTAYVVAGLKQARDAGVQVDASRIDRGAQWVRKALAENAALNPDLRAYMAYSLSEAGAINPVYDQRSKLSAYGLALLGLAMENAKDARVGEIAGAVEQAVQQDNMSAWWPALRDPMLDFAGDITAESTAFAVKLLSHQRPQSPLLGKAALWLMEHRDEGYWWSSTKQTAMVIYGLTDYLKATGELHSSVTANVYLNDRLVGTRKLDDATGLAQPEIKLAEAALLPRANKIRIETTGTGRLYYSARAEYYSTDEKLEKTGTVSLNLQREYFRLVPGKNGDRIVYDLAPLEGAVASGDVVAVRLTVTGTDWKYVMLEDPIPAGTEFIERDSVYELKSKPPWWEYYFTRRELHDDRLAIFQTWLPQGQHQYFYLLKVINPGIFQVRPARVGPMYQPAVMATTESRRMEVR